MAYSVPLAYNPYRHDLEQLLAAATNEKELFRATVNAPFYDQLAATHLGLGIIVLLLSNAKDHTIDRKALSDTEPALGAVRMSAKPFADIRIPANHRHNLIARCIAEGTPRQTTDWKYLFMPDLTPREARMNQAGAGIECSVVHPFTAARTTGALIYSYYEPPDKIGHKQHDFMAWYTQLVGTRLSQFS